MLNFVSLNQYIEYTLRAGSNLAWSNFDEHLSLTQSCWFVTFSLIRHKSRTTCKFGCDTNFAPIIIWVVVWATPRLSFESKGAGPLKTCRVFHPRRRHQGLSRAVPILPHRSIYHGRRNVLTLPNNASVSRGVGFRQA